MKKLTLKERKLVKEYAKKLVGGKLNESDTITSMKSSEATKYVSKEMNAYFKSSGNKKMIITLDLMDSTKVKDTYKDYCVVEIKFKNK